jgi:hippurate hydrolase
MPRIEMRLLVTLLVFAGISAPSPAQQVKLDSLIYRELPSLVAIYKSIHAAPELSHHEEKTSALLAEQLRSLSFDVTEHVGKYPNPNGKDTASSLL